MAKRSFSAIQKALMVIEASILLPIVHIISIFCPYQYIYKLSLKIGKLLFSKQKRDIIEENLKIIFPDREFSREEIDKIGTIICGYELRIMLEMIALGRMNFQEKLLYIRIKDSKFLYKVLGQVNYIGITLHVGNWEFMGSFINEIGISMGCLVERQFNPIIDQHLQNLRKKLSLPVIYNEISQMKPLFTFLKGGNSIAMVADQTYWFDPLFISFFNKEAAVPSGVSGLVTKFKLPMCYAWMQHLENGVYQFNVEDEIPSDTTAEGIMKNIYNRYEETIKKDVSNWYTLGSARWELTRERLKEWEKNPDSTRY